MVITLKTPAKIHLKIPSAFVVCCNFLLTLFNKLSIETNSVDPDQTAPICSLIWVYTVCWLSRGGFGVNSEICRLPNLLHCRPRPGVHHAAPDRTESTLFIRSTS